MLAALISNPVAYDPTLHPEAACATAPLALERLVVARQDHPGAGRHVYDHAPLPVRRCGGADQNKPVSCGDVTAARQPTDYFIEEVKQQLLDDPRLGATTAERVARLFGGGLKIYTTLDPAAQAAAEQARPTQLPANDKGITAAMVSVEPSTGAVRALVGGPGFDTYKYDIATLDAGPPDRLVVQDLHAAHRAGAGQPARRHGRGRRRRSPTPGATPNPTRSTARAAPSPASPGVEQRRVRAARADRRHRERDRHGRPARRDDPDFDRTSSSMTLGVEDIDAARRWPRPTRPSPTAAIRERAVLRRAGRGPPR